MPAHVLRAIHQTCHAEAASCRSKDSFAFHQLRSSIHSFSQFPFPFATIFHLALLFLSNSILLHVAVYMFITLHLWLWRVGKIYSCSLSTWHFCFFLIAKNLENANRSRKSEKGRTLWLEKMNAGMFPVCHKRSLCQVINVHENIWEHWVKFEKFRKFKVYFIP